MARPARYNADYYTHTADLRNDRKVKAIRTKFGAAGYGIFHMLLEALTDADHTALDTCELELELLAGDFGVEAHEIDAVIKFGQAVGYFARNAAGLLVCSELSKWLEPVFEKRNRAKTAALAGNKSNAPWLKHTEEVFARDNYKCLSCGTADNLTLDHITPRSAGGSDDLSNLQTLCGSCNSAKGVFLPQSVTVIPQSKVKESKGEESKEDTTSSFQSEVDAADAAAPPIEGAEPESTLPESPTPGSAHQGGAADVATPVVLKASKGGRPTEAEVLTYMTSMRPNNPLATLAQLAAKWHAHYTANGWKVGKNPMKDWQAACRTWLVEVPKLEVGQPLPNPQRNAVYANNSHATSAAARLHTPAPDASTGWGYPGG